MQVDTRVDSQVDMQPSNTPHDAHDAHLTPERLASFDDAPFSADEQTHLAACASCRAELAAVASLVAMAGTWGQDAPAANAPRLVEWETIAAGLRNERVTSSADEASDVMAPGLPASLRAGGGLAAVPAHQAPRVRRAFAPLLRRAAAALLLVGGGAIAGRVSGELSTGRTSGASLADASAGVVAESLAGVAASARTAAFGNEEEFRTVDEATGVLYRAQRDYERASLWLASNDTTMRDSEVYRARLAALDQMMAASRAALRDAPQDPVLNHYYLAAYTAREATLQALGGALPVDKIIERY